MEEKILTIVICAYNMEKYIQEALDSCIVDNMNRMEVLIMNDGSTDKTAEISRSYQEKYPEVFKLVDKPNGGWGSNINLAVGMAKGKYFKVLDADDWFDKSLLVQFLDLLEKNDVDAFISSHADVSSIEKVVDTPDWRMHSGSVQNLNQLKDPIFFSIWDACFKTSIVQAHHKELPEKTLYTDSLFLSQIIPFINKVFFINIPLYNYRVGRVGQSVSVESVMKHYKELLLVTRLGLKVLDENDNKKNIHLISRVAQTYRLCMIFIRKSYGKVKNVRKILMEEEAYLKKNYKYIYEATNNRLDFKILRMTRYVLLPFFVEVKM